MRGILRRRLCQEVPCEDEFDLIEAKGRGVNEPINFGVYIRHLHKYEVKLFIMQERMRMILNMNQIQSD